MKKEKRVLEIVEMALKGIVSSVYDLEDLKEGFDGIVAVNENDRYSEQIFFIEKENEIVEKFSSLDNNYKEQKKKYFK